MHATSTPRPEAPQSPLTDRRGAMHYLQIGQTRLAELTATGQLPSVKIGSRRCYRLADLDRYIAAQVEGGTP